MIFYETSLSGAYLIKPNSVQDELGFTSSSFCQNEFKEKGLNYIFVQSNISSNLNKGTLRGMHYQVEPYGEIKLVQCLKGSLYDVLIDLRPNSASYCKWVSFTLSDQNNHLLYIPKGVAHGIQTLEDDTVIYYQMSEFFAPDYASGVRWDDPVFGINWPISDPILSDKDKNWPDFLL